jgi:hypothetical protein
MHQTCPVPRLNSSNIFRICTSSLPDMSEPLVGHVQVLDTPMGRFPMGAIKGVSAPPLGWPLRWFENTLNQSFLSSNSLSLKLHSNSSLPGEIWVNSWVTHSIFKQEQFTNNLCVFVTLGDSFPRRTRCPPIATKVVMSFEKFILPSALWVVDNGKPN